MISLYLGTFVLSAAVLLLEIGLTRLFAISQWYHFAFLAVSLALLGSGAGGALHMAFPRLGRPLRWGWLALLSSLFALACGGILLANHLLPIDLYILAWDRQQVLYLALQYISLLLPFLAAGLAISLLLEAHPERAGPLYACNLAGSALGTLLPLLLLDRLGANRLPLAAGLLAVLAATCFLIPSGPGRSSRRTALGLTGTALFAALLVALLFHLPEALSLHLDPHKSLVQQGLFPNSQILYTAENALSRVDVVAGGPYHSFPGLPLLTSTPLPAQMALTLDGDHPSPLTLFQPGQTDPAFLHTMLTALPYQLHPNARVLLVEPMGGLDLLQALEQRAGAIVVLMENPLVIETVTGRFSQEIGHIFRSPNVQVKREGARPYLAREGPSFDLIVFALTGARAVVSAGAYSLAEEPLLTVEALHAALDRLAPGGTLVLMRWLQQPPSESLRALTTLAAALRAAGTSSPQEHIVAVRGWSSMLLLARRQPFSDQEIARVRTFCREHRFDLVWLPGLSREETNRYSRIQEGPIYYDAFLSFWQHPSPRDFYRTWSAEVRPARDERPFFFQFFRWEQLPQVLQQVGQTVQPFGGAGFLVLPTLLLLSGLFSGLLLVLPAALARRRGPPRGRGSTLLYFAALGLGFMAIEIPLLGRLTLFLGQPLYAASAVLFTLLLGSGLGSLIGGSRPAWLRPALAGLVALGAAYALGLPSLLQGLLGLALGWRLLLGFGLLLPLGFLLGIPFPAGLQLLGETGRPRIPWAWAANGCASVLGAIGAQMGVLSWGYAGIMLAGAACYGLAWLAQGHLRAGQ